MRTRTAAGTTAGGPPSRPATPVRSVAVRLAAVPVRLAAVAAVAGGVALAACSSTAPQASATGHRRSAGSSSAPVPTTSAPTSSAASSGSSGASTTCTAAELAASVAGEQGGAGTLEVTVALRNSGTTTCTMEGYPGVQLLAAGGTQIPTDELQGGSLAFEDVAPSPVSLAPGQSASFNMGYSDVPAAGQSSCPTATAVDVTAPGATPLQVPLQIQPCGGTVNVSAVFGAGSPATQTTAPPTAG